MGAKRDDIRAAVFAHQKRASEIVVVNGVEVEVRAPSVKQRIEILDAAGLTTGQPKPDELYRAALEGALRCAYVPGTAQPVFEPADRATLESEGPGGVVDVVGMVAVKLLWAQSAEAGAEGKESAAAPSGGSSIS